MDDRYRFGEVMEKYANQSGMIEYVTPYNKSFQRFVELIIQECYEVCEGNLITYDPEDLTYNDGVMDCALMIKKHFGLNK